MTALATLAGVALIALAVHDIFTVLFRPGAENRFSGALVRAVWATLRAAGGRRALSLAGPVALACVICSWAVLLVLGFTLIYLSHYPGDFALHAATRTPFLGALHVSLANVTTLGSATASPRATWLQILTPAEALIGFGLLTAAVAYLLQLYPVLSRRRSLAYEIHLLGGAARQLSLSVARMEPTTASQLYADLTSSLIAVERDLVKFPIAYYFAETDPRFALSATLPALRELAESGGGLGNPPSVRLRAAMLRRAIDDFARTVENRFLSGPHRSTLEALTAFAHDHLHGRHEPPVDERQRQRAA
jgi:hypothetical protein